MRKVFLNILFILFTLATNGQNASFEAVASRKQVSIGNSFEISFTLYNSKGRDFQPPDFKGFLVVSGPMVSNSMQFTNGYMTQSVSYSYNLQSQEVGKLIIGPASINANGSKIMSNPVEIEVVKGSPPSNSSAKNKNNDSENVEEHIFMKAVVDKTKAMQGEQITVTYKLYTRLDIMDMSVNKSPAFNGFWSQEIELPQKKNPYQEDVSGQTYTVVDLKKVALFPQRTGEMEIEPMEAEFVARINVNKRNKSLLDDFFNDPFFGGFGSKNVNLKVISNKITTQSVALPQDGKPESFNGLVGSFNMQTNLDKTETETNEAITLTIKISGTGNIKLIENLSLAMPPAIEVYEPKISDFISKENPMISGSKTFEYLLVPRHEGEHKIPPIEFSYYDPSKEKYVIVNSSEFLIKANPSADGAISNPVVGYRKEELELLGEDIRYIKTGDIEFKKENPLFWGSRNFIFLSVMPFLLFIGFLFYRKNHEKNISDSGLLKKRRANKLAKKHMSVAFKFLNSGNKPSFYEEISRALWGYISDKLTIPASELSKELIKEKMSSLNVNENSIQSFLNIIQNCELARFSPTGVNNLKEVYDESLSIISEIENQVKV